MNNQFPEKPKGIEVKHFNDHIKIKQNWFDIAAVWDTSIRDFSILFYAIFALLWFTGAFSVFIITLIRGEFVTTLFSIPFILFGILFLYFSVIRLINKTFITVNKKEIIVRNKFKIFSSNQLILKVSDLENIFSQVTTETIKNNKEETIYHYQVNAQTSNDTNKQIIETNNREQMLFIEKTLKDYLNIKDNPQEEELGKAD